MRFIRRWNIKHISTVNRKYIYLLLVIRANFVAKQRLCLPLISQVKVEVLIKNIILKAIISFFFFRIQPFHTSPIFTIFQIFTSFPANFLQRVYLPCMLHHQLLETYRCIADFVPSTYYSCYFIFCSLQCHCVKSTQLPYPQVTQAMSAFQLLNIRHLHIAYQVPHETSLLLKMIIKKHFMNHSNKLISLQVSLLI